MPSQTTQSESLNIKGTCTSVASDGRVTWSFVVEQVVADSTAETGGHVKYDSAKDKDCVSGLVRYPAIKGVTFTAVITSDGTIDSCSIESWPAKCDIKVEKGTKIKNEAADWMKDPSPPRTWLELIFRTGPAKTATWKRTLHLGYDEEMDMRADGGESVAGANCAKVKLETADQAKDAAVKIPREQFKAGRSAFNVAAGCAFKVDLHGGVMADKTKLDMPGQARWELEMVKRGFDADAAKAAGQPAPTK